MSSPVPPPNPGPTGPASKGPRRAPPVEHQRLVVRGSWLTLVMVGIGFAGATFSRGLEAGLILHLVTTTLLTCALGTLVGLLALPVLAARPVWRGWIRPVLIATAGPAFLLGVAAAVGRIL